MRIITSLLDILFPKRPDQELIAEETFVSFKRFLQPHHVADGIALSTYAEPLVRAAITENKFHNNSHAAELLGSLLTAWCAEQPVKTLLIPIPLGVKRERERGYNQTERIINAAIAKMPTLSSATLLKRRHETAPQTALSRNDRLRNVVGAFVVREDQKLVEYSDHRLILVDDVITTGATLQSAKSALLLHLPRETVVQCVGIAH